MTAAPLVRLQEVAELNPPLDEPLASDEAVSFLPMSAIDTESIIVVDTQTRPFGEVKKGYTPFASDDVLVAKITPCFENGKIAQAKLTHRVGFGSTEFHVIRARPTVLDARYLAHFLRQDRIRKSGEGRMIGSAGHRRVPEDFLANLEMRLPPLLEQRRIADLLDKADALRAMRRAALAQLDTLTQSIFLDMFGDPLANPKKLPTRAIGDIGDVVTGNTPSRSRTEFYGGTLDWLKSDNLGTGAYFATPAAETLSDVGRRAGRVAPQGAILVTCIAGSESSIGKAAMLDREAAFNQQINSLLVRSGNPHFVFAQLRGARCLIQRASTASMKGLVSKGRFERVALIWPSETQQAKFARVSVGIEASKTRIQISLVRFDDLFASLQHRAFRGEL